MLENLQATPGDSLIALMGAYRADPRPEKIDVGVGVYRDEQGRTPVMKAVKEAEQMLFNAQETKAYVGLAGDLRFNAALVEMVFGANAATLGERVRAVQTTGGCGALRALLDLVALARPDATVWVSDPTWLNHIPLVKSARLKLATYPYYDNANSKVRFEEMSACLAQLGPSDVVLLHGACHNPTGADLTEEQWDSIAELAEKRGFLPFVDLAYLGLGRGLEEDAYGVRRIAERVPEMLVAVSCSKNFGLYRERTGCAMLLHRQPQTAQLAYDNLLVVLRGNYSMPPDHGAATVVGVLSDPALRKSWEDELGAMRTRIGELRAAVSAQFRAKLGNGRFDHVAKQYGMFSLLGLSADQVKILREQHAIYMPGDSRTNVAGLQQQQIARFVDAVVSVCN
ncbi:MAG TPA: amino acid aminotransferase [Burkholderiaceae bacterium]